jgi:hypothetical protein
MNYIKKMMLVFIAVNVLVAPGFAGLIEDVDNLSPADAVLFQQKLQQKQFEATPDNTRGTGFIQLIDPKQFNAAFPGLGAIRNLYGGAFNLRYPVSERFLIGGNFSGAGNYAFKESSSKVYEDLFFGYGSAQFAADFRLLQTNNFILSTSAGFGVILGVYNYSKTDDNTQTYYNTNRWGSGLSSSLSLDATWNVANDWGFGMGVGSFSGKVGGMRKMFSEVDTTASEIDFSGTTFRISGSKYF